MSRLRELWTRLRRWPARRGAAQEERDRPNACVSVRRPARVIIGLGNPGERYAGTRHNVGFRVVECLAARSRSAWQRDPALDARVAWAEIAGVDCLLLEPQTFMNRSGASAAALLDRWPELDPEADLLVVHDDLDLPTGRIRLRPSGGAGGQRGMADILAALDTRAIARLRFGIGHPGERAEVLDWVLSPFSPEQEEVVASAVGRAADAIELSIREGLSQAMGQFNARS